MREDIDTSAHLLLDVVLLLGWDLVVLVTLNLVADRVHRRLPVPVVDLLVRVRT